MVQRAWHWGLAELLDPECPALRLSAAGDVPAAAQVDQEHFLRTIAAFPPNTVSAAIRFFFNPVAPTPQDRLSIALIGQATTDDVITGLATLLRDGPIRRLHRLSETPEIGIPWKQLAYACDIVRPLHALEATVSPEFNAKALPAYCMVRPFLPREDNDYLLLDRILSHLREPVVVEVRVEPTDISQEVSAFIRYVSHLQQVNRSWDIEDEDLVGDDWRYGGEDHRASLQPIRPLRTRDPVVEDVLRQAQRFVERLSSPHLRFHVRCFTQSEEVARLVASVVAESALEEGSYCLCDSHLRDRSCGTMPGEQNQPHTAISSSLQRTLTNCKAIPYDVLARFAVVAPVNELVGLFRFPMASRGSPCCIRKNTDPPNVGEEEMLLVGEDAQFL